jgi:hypothetical protein
MNTEAYSIDNINVLLNQVLIKTATELLALTSQLSIKNTRRVHKRAYIKTKQTPAFKLLTAKSKNRSSH